MRGGAERRGGMRGGAGRRGEGGKGRAVLRSLLMSNGEANMAQKAIMASDSSGERPRQPVPSGSE